jgi:hypothetical protein
MYELREGIPSGLSWRTERWTPKGPKGPPVDWDKCSVCGTPMGKDDERFRVEDENGLGQIACAKCAEVRTG